MGLGTSGGVVVIFVGAELPYGDATANRAVSLAKALRLAGWLPLLLSDRAPVDSSHESHGLVDGIAYANIGPPGGGRAKRLTDRFRRQNRIAQTLQSRGLALSDVRLLIVHSTLYGRLLQRWADRCGVPVVADLMERHEPTQFARGRLDPQYLRHRRLSRLCARRPAGLLLISTQLLSAVQPRVPALVVPPFVDAEELRPDTERLQDAANTVTLAYAGTPNRKDLLGPVVEAIADLDPSSRARVKLTVAGLTKERLLQLGEVREPALQSCGGSVEVVGRLSREDVRRLWNASDFCVLIRPKTGYAVAGFPSKVPEAMAAGCALFGTAHGDLADFVHDGRDAILTATSSHRDVALALRRALVMTRAEVETLREAARTSAAESLSVAAWAPQISTFLLRLDDHRRR